MIALPAWLRIARVAAPLLAAALLLGLLLWTRGTLDRTRLQRDEAVADVVEFRRLATDATVTAAADGTRELLSIGDAKAALAGAVRDRDDARAALTRIDRETRATRTRAAASDAALVRAQSANAARYARAAPEIARLEAAEPTGSPQADAAAIEIDSKAAWEAWR